MVQGTQGTEGTKRLSSSYRISSVKQRPRSLTCNQCRWGACKRVFKVQFGDVKGLSFCLRCAWQWGICPVAPNPKNKIKTKKKTFKNVSLFLSCLFIVLNSSRTAALSPSLLCLPVLLSLQEQLFILALRLFITE